MTLQPRPRNVIEQRKTAVRKYSRNGAIAVGGGVIGGLALALLTTSWAWLILGLIVAVIGGVYNWSKINKIVNHHDNY